MNELLIRELIIMLNAISVELKKMNENIEINANATGTLADQVNELGIEIYKYRMDNK